MKKHSLPAEKRESLGRKVKKLREQGYIPGTVYGKKIESISLTISRDAFEKVYKEAGETGLVELIVDKETRPVLIHTVQHHPVDGDILHVEFFQVDLKEKVHAKVPVEFVGEAPVVADKTGVLLAIIDEVEVEALPAELPEKIALDVSGLTAVDQEVKVKDLPIPAGVTLLTDGELTVVKVGSLVSKEAAEQAAAEEAAAAAASAESGEATQAPESTAPEASTLETPPEEKKE